MRDPTAQTEPLTIGQQLVAKWESLDSGWSEPADLADAIDYAIATERERCAMIAQSYYRQSTFNSRVRSLGQDAADGIANAVRNSTN